MQLGLRKPAEEGGEFGLIVGGHAISRILRGAAARWFCAKGTPLAVPSFRHRRTALATEVRFPQRSTPTIKPYLSG
jgi:hypothetical protein